MWLVGRLIPDHKTIADFRKDNGAAIRKVCAQFVALFTALNLLPSIARLACVSKPGSRQRDTAALQLLTSYVCALARVQSPASPEVSHLVVTHLHDLIALSVGAARDGAAMAGRSVRAARLQAIKYDIAANLANGSLTVAAVAARHCVTPRYLHKLFEGERTTFTQFILRARLDRAYRMLRDPRFVARSITSIAYDAGFADLSYFNRTFRRRYNAAPSDIRSSAER